MIFFIYLSLTCVPSCDGGVRMDYRFLFEPLFCFLLSVSLISGSKMGNNAATKLIWTLSLHFYLIVSHCVHLNSPHISTCHSI